VKDRTNDKAVLDDKKAELLRIAGAIAVNSDKRIRFVQTISDDGKTEEGNCFLVDEGKRLGEMMGYYFDVAEERGWEVALVKFFEDILTINKEGNEEAQKLEKILHPLVCQVIYNIRK